MLDLYATPDVPTNRTLSRTNTYCHECGGACDRGDDFCAWCGSSHYIGEGLLRAKLFVSRGMNPGEIRLVSECDGSVVAKIHGLAPAGD